MDGGTTRAFNITTAELQQRTPSTARRAGGCHGLHDESSDDEHDEHYEVWVVLTVVIATADLHALDDCKQ